MNHDMPNNLGDTGNDTSGDATATNAASSTRPMVTNKVAPQPMTDAELREVAAQESVLEARRNAAHDAQVHNAAGDDELAVTGTGHGDNRDETGDPDIAAGLGGLGGALVGAAAGAMLGPAGALAGAVVGGLAAGGLSGVAVDAIDKTDDDTTLSGLPSDATSAENNDTTGNNSVIV